MTKNHLRNETSPYLLQHVNNPVDWYPWGQEALDKARREDKPILLSIGYSACHWCHVMAHESFMDEATAKIMNELFVNIKVDREERPDLDRIYQLSHQLLTQRAGGWPLTVFLTPDTQVPFFAGTYFPLTPRYQMPAFKDVLRYIAKFYHDNKQALAEQNQSLLNTLESLVPKTYSDGVEFNTLPIQNAVNNIKMDFDRSNGGFGAAPKFPHPMYLELLLQQSLQDKSLLSMVVTSLIKMAEGGLYDQLGGGFYRYSVDAEWRIPHFEKMLYDNAQLLSLYAQAYVVTRNPLFLRIAQETGAWVIREMQAPAQGYYSTLDADSAGVEGKFYVWDHAEIKALLTAEEFKIAAIYFGLDQPANFEDKWHLHIAKNIDEIARELNLSEKTVQQTLASVKQKLLTLRNERQRPHLDEKILAGWNGLMIKALAEAGRYLENPAFIISAQTAVDFIRKQMWSDGRLFATYKDGGARFMGYLDDYAFLLAGILALLEVQWRDEDFNFAIQLAEAVLTHFFDHAAGGFFFTADDHEALIHRPKNLMDEAIPSSNGIIARLLLRLWHISGDPRYRAAAEKTLKTVWPNLMQYPEAYVALLLALEEVIHPPEMIIIRGENPALKEWQRVTDGIYAPHRLIFAIPATAKNLPAILAEKKPETDIIAYVCHGQRCLPPIMTLAEFRKAIKNDKP